MFSTMPNRPRIPDYTLYGPVITDKWDPVYLGADKETNNTGELTAIGEACIWLLEKTGELDADGNKVHAEIHYDSEYARDLATRRAAPKTNHELANKVADLVDKVRENRRLTFRHVKGHSGDVGNDSADKYADLGAKGRSSPQWWRWSQTPTGWEIIQGRDARLIESCRRCGQIFNTGVERGSHEARCQNIGVEMNPEYDRCRKCGTDVTRGNGRYHETYCRGSKEANSTCRICNKRIFDLRLLKVHEFDCQRLEDRRQAAAAAPPPPPPPPPLPPGVAAPGQCPQCQMMCGRNLSRHLGRCRGSELANRTCSKCKRVYATYDSCRSHESKCRV